MSTHSETSTVQNTPPLLQDLQKLPPIVIAIAILLGMTATGFLPWKMTLFLIVLVWIGLSQIERRQALKEAKARAASYTNCIGPVVVSSIHPLETVEEVQDRADDWKMQLSLSGNPYADKIPVIAMPYNVMLTEHGQLTAGWSIYQRQVGERQHIENIKWYEGKCPAELKGLFASAVLPAPKHENIVTAN